jgi:thiol:disulfide interchange protein DsbD
MDRYSDGMMLLRRCLAAIALLAGLVAPATAQIDSLPKVRVRLVTEQSEVAPGGRLSVAMEQIIRPGWHTYWLNPGEAGAPTTLDWTLPVGWSASAIRWPYPHRLPVGPLMNYGYEGRAWLLMDVTAPRHARLGDTVTLKAHASWLVCSATLCVPEDGEVTATATVSAHPSPPYATVADAFAAARSAIPVPSPWPVHFARKDGLSLFLAATSLAPRHAEFFPLSEGVIAGASPQSLSEADGGVLLHLAEGPKAAAAQSIDGVLVLTSQDGSVQALSVSAATGAVPQGGGQSMGLGLALLFAFLGGLILNLMPCVLPVLAIKALAVAGHASGHKGAAAREGLAYGAGAILSFLALGGAVILLRAGGAAIGWGFQLQDPRVVAGFALVMFAVGLNLSGVFELPFGLSAGDSLTRRGGAVGAFFTGVLAVAVAAPCTAPFMATAIGFALTQGEAVALGVFAALGLGFAAPFMLIGLVPPLQRLLPKPGAWMLVFKQFLAFPMYGAAAWLLWVVAQQAGEMALASVLAAAIALAFGIWAWSLRASSRGAGKAFATLAALAGFALTIAGVAFAGSGETGKSNLPQAVGALNPEPYSPARLSELRTQNRPVFVDATAAWCITCLVNEKAALSSPAVAAAFARTHTAYLVADWTRRDAAITALLESHGRSGVPLYLYYRPGAAEAEVLPQILTTDVVLAAVEGK